MPGKVSGVATVTRKADKEKLDESQPGALLIWRDKDGNLKEKRTK